MGRMTLRWAGAAGFAGLAAAFSFGPVQAAAKVCMASDPPGGDPAVTVSMTYAEDGEAVEGRVHWAVPNRPGRPSMVHITYPLVGSRADTRPDSIITMNVARLGPETPAAGAHVQISVDGMEAASRPWELYSQAVEQMKLVPGGSQARASFYGPVPFTRNLPDGRRDDVAQEALTRISRGAMELEVRLVGTDGRVMESQRYELFDMAAPAPSDVTAALQATQKMAAETPERCSAV